MSEHNTNTRIKPNAMVEFYTKIDKSVKKIFNPALIVSITPAVTSASMLYGWGHSGTSTITIWASYEEIKAQLSEVCLYAELPDDGIVFEDEVESEEDDD